MMTANYWYGDIVIGEMIYTDYSATKKRPLLILSQEGEDYLVVFITSQDSSFKNTSYQIPMNNINNLRDNSYILLSKVTTLHETLLWKQLGKLSEQQKTDIKKWYINYFSKL